MNHKFLPSRILGPAAGVCSMARSPLRGASGQDWSLRASKSNGLIALLIVLAFVGSRAALLVTSYDVNQNWEEPVFLFSATELQRDGIRNIFDHQDDLNHGGSVVVLLLFVGVLWRGYRIARRVRDGYMKLCAMGFTLLLVVQALMNISVVLSLAPNKGIPLPFISYGSSSLVASLASLGLLLAISKEASE